MTTINEITKSPEMGALLSDERLHLDVLLQIHLVPVGQSLYPIEGLHIEINDSDLTDTLILLINIFDDHSLLDDTTHLLPNFKHIDFHNNRDIPPS